MADTETEKAAKATAKPAEADKATERPEGVDSSTPPAYAEGVDTDANGQTPGKDR